MNANNCLFLKRNYAEKTDRKFKSFMKMHGFDRAGEGIAAFLSADQLNFGVF